MHEQIRNLSNDFAVTAKTAENLQESFNMLSKTSLALGGLNQEERELGKTFY